MQINQFLRRVSIGIPIALVALLLASPTGAQTTNPYPFQVLVPPPPYISADPSLGGTVITFIPTDSYPAADDGVSTVPLPFTFNFFGQSYNQAYVSTNGYINFLAPSSYSNNICPLRTSVPGSIYAFWDDLDTSFGSVRYLTLGTAPNRQFVIEWNNVGFLGATGKRISFEIVLSETGTITLQYQGIDNDPSNPRETGSSATFGLDSPFGDLAVEYPPCNAPSIGFGEFAIRFGQVAIPPPSQSPPPVAIPVAVDVKPWSCHNRLNVGGKRKGVLRVAILGKDGSNVTDIDPGSVKLEGVPALSWSHGDVGTTPNQCNRHRRDGKMDITFKFDREDVIRALGTVNDGQQVQLHLTGNLRPTQSTATRQNGTSIRGEDKVTIIKKAKEKDWHSERRRHNDNDNDNDNDDDDD